MKKRLLILGSLREFVQLIDMARARGIYTVVIDGYPNSIGKQHADKSYDIPPGNIDEIVQICIEEQIDSITTSYSDYLFECMVKIAAKAGLKCYFTPEKLACYRNKAVMKDMLTSLGISTPRFCTLKPDFTDDELQGIRFPVVTKPLDKYGSRGVFVLNSTQEIRSCFQEVCETSDIKEILVEEYHDGYEFNMMTWILDGNVHVLSIADREKTAVEGRDIPISTRNVYPSRLMDDVFEQARDVLQKVADHMHQTEGILSMQFFWKPGAPVSVCEVAGRIFGYEHELVEYCSGLSVESLLLDYLYDEEALRQNLLQHNPYFKNCCAVLYFHGRNGMVVDDQSAADALASLPEVREYWPFYRKGETIVPHGANPYVIRYYLAGADRKSIDAATQTIFDRISVLSPEGEEVLFPDRMPEYPHGPMMS